MDFLQHDRCRDLTRQCRSVIWLAGKKKRNQATAQVISARFDTFFTRTNVSLSQDVIGWNKIGVGFGHCKKLSVRKVTNRRVLLAEYLGAAERYQNNTFNAFNKKKKKKQLN